MQRKFLVAICLSMVLSCLAMAVNISGVSAATCGKAFKRSMDFRSLIGDYRIVQADKYLSHDKWITPFGADIGAMVRIEEAEGLYGPVLHGYIIEEVPGSLNVTESWEAMGVPEEGRYICAISPTYGNGLENGEMLFLNSENVPREDWPYARIESEISSFSYNEDGELAKYGWSGEGGVYMYNNQLVFYTTHTKKGNPFHSYVDKVLVLKRIN